MIPKALSPTADLRETSEEPLVALARERDEAAVRELVRRLNPRLFRVARGVVATDVEAEEVLQEAYLAAFSRLDQFRGEARFSTWITRIVLNAAGMHKRRSRPHEEYDTVAEDQAGERGVLAFPGAGSDGPEAALGRSQLRGVLEAVVSELPPELRLVFLLREAEGLSVLTIARDLQLNPVTVKTRLFRARRRLRAALEARLHGGFEAVFPFDGMRCAGMADRVVESLRRVDACRSVRRREREEALTQCPIGKENDHGTGSFDSHDKTRRRSGACRRPDGNIDDNANHAGAGAEAAERVRGQSVRAAGRHFRHRGGGGSLQRRPHSQPHRRAAVAEPSASGVAHQQPR